MRCAMKKNRYRNILTGIGLAIVLAQLAGCSATELEDRCFPMLAVVDYRLEQVEFMYGFPELSQKDNTDMDEAKVDAPLTQGVDFAEALDSYNGQLDKKADCNHLKVLLISEKMFDEQKLCGEMLDYLQETEIFPRNVYVCVTADVGAVLDTAEGLPTDLGSYLEKFLQNHEAENSVELTTLGTVLDETENHVKTLSLPYLVVEEGAIRWEGVYRVRM